MDYFAKELITSSNKNGSKVIFAADSSNWEIIRQTLKLHKNEFAAIKMHPEHVLMWHMSHKTAIRQIKRLSGNLPIILDAKLADIDTSNKMKAEFYLNQGYDAIICHGFQGFDGVAAVSDVCKKTNKGLFLIVSMSTKDNLFGIKEIDKLVKIAKSLNLSGIVAPANNYVVLKRVRKLLGPEKLILSPGIGAQGGDKNKSLKYSDFVIIGRSMLKIKPKETSSV